MVGHDELNQRETRRRRALWTLAHLAPGDPRALAVWRVLDELDRQDHSSQALSVDQVLNEVVSEPHPIGTSIVREEAIPQPWRERFLCASRGSTRVEDGAYFHDWLKFIEKWKQEMAHLESHREILRRQR